MKLLSSFNFWLQIILSYVIAFAIAMIVNHSHVLALSMVILVSLFFLIISVIISQKSWKSISDRQILSFIIVLICLLLILLFNYLLPEKSVLYYLLSIAFSLLTILSLDFFTSDYFQRLHC